LDLLVNILSGRAWDPSAAGHGRGQAAGHKLNLPTCTAAEKSGIPPFVCQAGARFLVDMDLDDLKGIEERFDG
jgi:hypothetical protein